MHALDAVRAAEFDVGDLHRALPVARRSFAALRRRLPVVDPQRGAKLPPSAGRRLEPPGGDLGPAGLEHGEFQDLPAPRYGVERDFERARPRGRHDRGAGYGGEIYIPISTALPPKGFSSPTSTHRRIARRREAC